MNRSKQYNMQHVMVPTDKRRYITFWEALMITKDLDIDSGVNVVHHDDQCDKDYVDIRTLTDDAREFLQRNLDSE